MLPRASRRGIGKKADRLRPSRRAGQLAAAAGLAAHRLDEHQGNPNREQPPDVVALVLEEPGERQQTGDPGGRTPVVTDDEVPREAYERPDVSHASATTGRGARRR